jgi:hypothetical protein
MTTGYLRYSKKLELGIMYWEILAPAFEAGIPGTADKEAIAEHYWHSVQVFADYHIGAQLCRTS